tara:strand:+ start:26 stop:658 length:633 start_codon:yes stop_codon:yes gene_type:complete
MKSSLNQEKLEEIKDPAPGRKEYYDKSKGEITPLNQNAGAILGDLQSGNSSFKDVVNSVRARSESRKAQRASSKAEMKAYQQKGWGGRLRSQVSSNFAASQEPQSPQALNPATTGIEETVAVGANAIDNTIPASGAASVIEGETQAQMDPSGRAPLAPVAQDLAPTQNYAAAGQIPLQKKGNVFSAKSKDKAKSMFGSGIKGSFDRNLKY